MTSAKLFSKVLKMDFRQRAWSFLLGFIVFFLKLPVTYLLMMGNAVGADPIRAILVGQEMFPRGDIMMFMITVTAACICAPSGFTYLFKRPGTDYYHSLPVRRETLFAAKYTNGVLIYLLSLGLNMLFTVVLAASRGGLAGGVLQRMVFVAAANVVLYLLLYSSALTAVLLTGRLSVAVLMMGFLYLFGYWVRLLRVNMTDMFMDSFTSYPYNSLLGDSRTIWSPLTYCEWIVDGGICFVFGLLLAAGFAVLALVLYRLRPSEASDRALAFSWMRIPFKFLVCVPAGLTGGMFFYSMRASLAWFVFGMAVFWFVSCVFVEMLGALSFRQGFAHLKSSGLCLAASVFMFLAFALDLTGYDSYLPEKDSLEFMAISVNGLDTSQDIYTWGESGVPGYESPRPYRLEHMRLKDLDAAYELAEAGVRALGQAEKQPLITVRYGLKNGRDVYRVYPLCTEEQTELLAEVYASKEYKEGCFSVLTDREHLEYYKGIRFSDFLGQEYEADLSSQEMERFYEVFTADLLGHRLEELSTQRVGTLSFQLRVGQPWDSGSYDSVLGFYPVYQDDVRTLALLEELGIQTRYDPSTVTKVEVYNYMDTADVQATYTDPEKIQAILPCLRTQGALSGWYYDADRVVPDGFEARITYEGQEEFSYNLYSLSLPDLPDFLRDDLDLE